MTDDEGTTLNADEEILARFVSDLERRGSVIIDDYLRRYPHLAQRIRELVQIQDRLADARQDGDDEAIPARLGEFHMLRRVARGGMGEVYEAVQERLDRRRVAVKVIRRGRTTLEARDRFLREQSTLAKLHHTHIVPIFAAGEDGRLQYFAMPFIDGAALSHVVHTARRFDTEHPGDQTPSLVQLAEMTVAAGTPAPDAPPPRWQPSPAYFRSVAEVMADIADAVHHAHEAGVLHRDVKPSNIMVDRSGQRWIIDFGLAGYLTGHEEPSKPESPTTEAPAALTQGPMGTPQYMAPEQYEDPKKVDRRCDVWGLGATLYELLALRPAFHGATLEEIREWVCTRDPKPLSECVENVPPDLAAICRKAMTRPVDGRYETADAFAADLRRWLGHEPTRARPAWVGRRALMWGRRNPGWAAACLVALFAAGALAAVGGIAHERNQEAERQSLIGQIQQIRLQQHSVGWPREAWDLVRKAADIRKDEQLASQAAGTLIGLDARQTKRWEINASSIALDPKGPRVLMGGVGTWAGRPPEGAKLWSGRDADVPAVSHAVGDGPVAFAADGTPLQLVAKDRWTLLLWDVAGQQKVQEFPLVMGAPSEPVKVETQPTMQLSADGSLVVGSTLRTDGKGTLSVWEVSSGKLVRQWEKHASALAFSPDGRYLAGGDKDGGITIWSLDKAAPVASFSDGRMPIECLTFGRDPRIAEDDTAESTLARWSLAAGDAGGSVNVWDLRTRHPCTRCRGAHYDIYAVAFHPDGMTVAAAGRDYVRLWDLATGQLLLSARGASYMTGLAFSPAGDRLAVSGKKAFGQSGTYVWDLEEGRGARRFRGLAAPQQQITFSPDGRFLAALADDWQVALWDVKAGRLLHILDVPRGYFSDNAGLCFSHDGKLFAFSTAAEARMWDVASGKERKRWSLSPALGDRLAFDKSGKKLLLFRVETKDGQRRPFGEARWEDHPRVCRVRDLLAEDGKKPLVEITDYFRGATRAMLAPDGSYIVIAGIQDEGRGQRQWLTRAFDLAGKVLWERNTPADNVNDIWLSLDPHGTVLVFGDPGRYELLKMPSGHSLGPVREGFLGPAAKYVFASSKLVRRDDGKELVGLSPDQENYHAAFDAGGDRLAVTRDDQSVVVWDLAEVQRRLAEFGLGW